MTTSVVNRAYTKIDLGSARGVAKKSQSSLGRVELELLQYIDKNHPISVGEVAEYWCEKNGGARTTVLTMMERLLKKGFLARKKIDGVYKYSPKQSVSSVIGDVVSDFVQGVLGGSIAPLAAYLSQERKLDPNEVEQLKQMVEKLSAKSDLRSTDK